MLVREALYGTIELWLDAGVSHVVDFTTYAGINEAELGNRICPRADVLNVHCRSTQALDRFAERIARHPQRPADGAAVSVQRRRAAGDAAKTTDPLRIGRPLIEVNTDDGYEPTLEEVVAWILEQSGRSLPL